MKQTYISILSAVLLLGCFSGHKPVDKFTYNFQYYDMENDQVQNKGQVDLKKITEEFNNFPWEEQTAKFNNPESKSNPTIGIKDHMNDHDLGIMTYPGDDGPVFVIYHSYLVDGEWEESFREGYSRNSIEKGLELFFNRNHRELPKFLEKNSTKEFGIPIF